MNRNRLRRHVIAALPLILAVGCALAGPATPPPTDNPPTATVTPPATPTAIPATQTPPVPAETIAPPTETTAPPTETPVILPHTTIDPSTLTGKLVMGYQGWFTCPGDGSQINGYSHWIKDGYGAINLESFRVDMWPDTSELTAPERCPTDLVYADGSPAYLYSAANDTTVLRHFQWMSEYGIDGIFLQRFGSQLIYPETLSQRNELTRDVRAAAEAYGRVWAIMYDVTGTNEKSVDLVQTFQDDWKYLVDVLKVTESPAYLHHNGLPVLEIWGLGFDDRPGTVAEAQQLVDFFQNNPDPRYRAYLIGGVPIWWRTRQPPAHADPAWADYYCSLDAISPWTPGHAVLDAHVDEYQAALNADMAQAQACGADLLPVVYPGIAYHNPGGRPFNEIPRRGGRLYWRQVYSAVAAGATMLFNAMFDEVDEATAMYKIAATSAQAPAGLEVITMDTDGECLPNDWYLRLAGEASEMLRGERPLTSTIPITPPPSPDTCQVRPRMRLRLSTTSDWTTVSLAGLTVNSVQIVSVSTGVAEAYFQADGNLLVLTQSIAAANAGQAVEMVAEAFLDPVNAATFFVTIGRGNLGATRLEMYFVSGSDSNLVDTIQWSGLGGDGQNLRRFEVSAELFPTVP